MGNFRLGRSHKGLGFIIGMHILLNRSLVGCRVKFTVLVFLLGLVGKRFFKFNSKFRILNIYLGSLRLLSNISLGVL